MAEELIPEEAETVTGLADATESAWSPPSVGSAPSTTGPTPSLRGGGEVGAGAVDRLRTVLSQGRSAVARIMVFTMGAATLAGIPVVLLAPGRPLAKGLGIGALVVALGVYGSVIFRVPRPRDATGSRFVGPWVAIVGTTAAITLNYALGLFSPLPFAGLVGFVIIYLGIGASEVEARLLFVTSAVGYATAYGLAIAGVLPEIGLFSAGPAHTSTKWFALVGAEIALTFAYALARTTARYGQQLLSRLDRAVREATQREALLREVRADLERAAGIGTAGLFTDLELGAFVLGEVIGRGGMGEVYAATDRRDGGEAAVKLLRRDVLAHKDAVARFEREARIAAELDGAHVVQVLEVGGLDAPLPFIAMERLHGDDLAGLLRTRGKLPLAEVAAMVEQVCKGLSAAHARGIVHRDLKPQNLFLDRGTSEEPRWKILDFGVSKLLVGPDASIGGDEVVGTPAYMAPEQAAGSAPVDARADLHALCVVAYRALTGAPAFANGPAPVVLRAVAETMPQDPARLATLPPDVPRVLRIGLAKSPEDRFASAEELADALRWAVRGKLPEPLRTRADQLLGRQGWGEAAPAPTSEA